MSKQTIPHVAKYTLPDDFDYVVRLNLTRAYIKKYAISIISTEEMQLIKEKEAKKSNRIEGFPITACVTIEGTPFRSVLEFYPIPIDVAEIILSYQPKVKQWE
jgi:hypothetical protein